MSENKKGPGIQGEAPQSNANNGNARAFHSTSWGSDDWQHLLTEVFGPGTEDQQQQPLSDISPLLRLTSDGTLLAELMQTLEASLGAEPGAVDLDNTGLFSDKTINAIMGEQLRETASQILREQQQDPTAITSLLSHPKPPQPIQSTATAPITTPVLVPSLPSNHQPASFRPTQLPAPTHQVHLPQGALASSQHLIALPQRQQHYIAMLDGKMLQRPDGSPVIAILPAMHGHTVAVPMPGSNSMLHYVPIITAQTLTLAPTTTAAQDQQAHSVQQQASMAANTALSAQPVAIHLPHIATALNDTVQPHGAPPSRAGAAAATTTTTTIAAATGAADLEVATTHHLVAAAQLQLRHLEHVAATSPATTPTKRGTAPPERQLSAPEAAHLAMIEAAAAVAHVNNNEGSTYTEHAAVAGALGTSPVSMTPTKTVVMPPPSPRVPPPTVQPDDSTIPQLRPAMVPVLAPVNPPSSSTPAMVVYLHDATVAGGGGGVAAPPDALVSLSSSGAMSINAPHHTQTHPLSDNGRHNATCDTTTDTTTTTNTITGAPNCHGNPTTTAAAAAAAAAPGVMIDFPRKPSHKRERSLRSCNPILVDPSTAPTEKHAKSLSPERAEVAPLLDDEDAAPRSTCGTAPPHLAAPHPAVAIANSHDVRDADDISKAPVALGHLSPNSSLEPLSAKHPEGISRDCMRMIMMESPYEGVSCDGAVVTPHASTNAFSNSLPCAITNSNTLSSLAGIGSTMSNVTLSTTTTAMDGMNADDSAELAAIIRAALAPAPGKRRGRPPGARPGADTALIAGAPVIAVEGTSPTSLASVSPVGMECDEEILARLLMEDPARKHLSIEELKKLVRKEKNRISAAVSRQKTQMYTEQLEGQVRRLQDEQQALNEWLIGESGKEQGGGGVGGRAWRQTSI